MRTKRIYRIGIIIIFIGSFIKPLSLLLLGKKNSAQIVSSEPFLNSGGIYFSQVLVYVDGSNTYSITVQNKNDLKIGQKVTIIYYKSSPQEAKLLIFSKLFLWPIIDFATSQFIWWAFLSSFTNIFDKPPFHSIKNDEK